MKNNTTINEGEIYIWAPEESQWQHFSMILKVIRPTADYPYYMCDVVEWSQRKTDMIKTQLYFRYCAVNIDRNYWKKLV